MQLYNIKKEDIVFAVTEGGETSSVIGTILAAWEMYEDKDEALSHLYFVYNNPDEVLLGLNWSKSVLENDFITKIRLATGPQAVSGSTRMQASTISTFVIGVLLE